MSGVAIIEVSGLLVNGLGSLRPAMGMTGYDGIRVALRNALADKAVQRIAFSINSHGGEVAGCFDLADDIFF